MKNKKGELFLLSLTIMFFLLLSILLVSILIYFQINLVIYELKTDIFYIAQNSINSIDKNELAYKNYIIDEGKMISEFKFLLKKNHPNKALYIERFVYNKITNFLEIEVCFKFKPIIYFNNEGYDIFINEKVKIKLMEVK